MTYSKKQLNEKLDAMGVIHDPDSPVNELKALYDEVKTVSKEDTEEQAVAAIDNTPTAADEGATDATDTAAEDPDSPVNELKSPQSVRVNCSKLALRSCPSKNSPMIDVLEEGAEFTAEEFESEWLYVPDRDGYVMREFVEAL